MAISDTRQRVMPKGEDRDDTHSQSLAFKEAVVLSNPSESELRGEVYIKYGNFIIFDLHICLMGYFCLLHLLKALSI